MVEKKMTSVVKLSTASDGRSGRTVRMTAEQSSDSGVADVEMTSSLNASNVSGLNIFRLKLTRSHASMLHELLGRMLEEWVS